MRCGSEFRESSVFQTIAQSVWFCSDALKPPTRWQECKEVVGGVIHYVDGLSHALVCAYVRYGRGGTPIIFFSPLFCCFLLPEFTYQCFLCRWKDGWKGIQFSLSLQGMETLLGFFCVDGPVQITRTLRNLVVPLMVTGDVPAATFSEINNHLLGFFPTFKKRLHHIARNPTRICCWHDLYQTGNTVMFRIMVEYQCAHNCTDWLLENFQLTLWTSFLCLTVYFGILQGLKTERQTFGFAAEFWELISLGSSVKQVMLYFVKPKVLILSKL